jgi:hypothetical protein
VRTLLRVGLGAWLACGVGPAAIATEPPAEYDFVLDTARFVRLELTAWQTWGIDVGRLDAAGNFIPQNYEDNSRLFKIPPPPKNPVDEQPIVELIKVPVINEPAKGADVETVYEFRSGLLIKGLLKRGEGFTPELASRIISFEDYHNNPSAPRIYNLPGRFVPKPAAPPKK